MLAIVAALGGRFQLLSRVQLDLSPDVLLDRARTIERQIGLPDPLDREWGFGRSPEYIAWLRRTASDTNPFARLRLPQPSALLFWYRSSPRYLVASGGRGYVNFSDPPITATGMVNMVLGADGKLYEFHLVPTQVESLSSPAPVPVDWQAFFDAAGLDRTRFTEATPDWTPRAYADARQAWTGTFALMPDVPVRVDVASHRGWPVYFQLSGPWARPSRMVEARPNESALIFALIQALLFPAFIAGAALLARRNVKRGKGDRRGATRVAVVVFALSMTAWLFRAHHLPEMGIAIDQFFAAAAAALFQAGLFWIFYLAVEPQIRKVWPRILITWSRLVGGSVRDPLVGRDLLVGTAAGLLLTIVTLLYQYVPLVLGRPEFEPVSSNLDPMLGPAALIGTLADQLAASIQNGMLGVLGLALFRMILRSTGAAFAASGCSRRS
jgi:serine/threonine-protein kinase